MKTEQTPHKHEYVRIEDAINYSLEQAEKDQNPIQGIPSGFPTLDRLTRGWMEGDLAIIGGRPGSGNTALALSMARNAAEEYHVPTAYFSFGTSYLDIADRLIVSESGIPMEMLHGLSKMGKDRWQRLELSLKKLSRSPLYLDGTPAALRGDELLVEFQTIVERLVEEAKVKLIFVDGFQATIPDWVMIDPDNESLAHYCRKSLRMFKQLAGRYEASIVVLSRVGGALKPDYPGPFLQDLDIYCRQAAEFADKIILLHRPSLCGFSSEGDVNTLELRLVHNRNGRTGTVELRFDSDRIRVVNPEELHASSEQDVFDY